MNDITIISEGRSYAIAVDAMIRAIGAIANVIVRRLDQTKSGSATFMVR